jgi:pyrroloquinoline-quinone synthase
MTVIRTRSGEAEMANIIGIIVQLDGAVAARDLQQHPFYQAWRKGELPVEALATYAGDYGAFIRTIDQGWDTVGQADYAEEERVHAQLWDDFAGELGQTVGTPNTEAVAQLVATARELFAEPATALGALYAFEAQQPLTSQSKLDGLLAHYDISEPARRYFAIHCGDYAEAEWIRDAALALDGDAAHKCVASCERMAVALWDALSGVYAGCDMDAEA